MKNFFRGYFFSIIAIIGNVDAADNQYHQKKVLTSNVVEISGVDCSFIDDSGGNGDVPDAPVRMVRDPSGDVIAIASNTKNIPYNVINHAHFTRSSCKSQITANSISDPSKFSDNFWISSLYYSSDNRFRAIVHNEYWGAKYSKICHNKLNGRPVWGGICVYVSVISADYDLKDKVFRTRGVDDLVAAFPYKFDENMTWEGIRDPSNVIKSPVDGQFYFFATAVNYREQQRGSCLFRSKDGVKPWVTYGSNGREKEMNSPYNSESIEKTFTCDIVTALPISGVSYHAGISKFVAVGHSNDIGGGIGGIFYMTSGDLRNWSLPNLLLEGYSMDRNKKNFPIIGYPSVVSAVNDKNGFDEISRGAIIYYIEVMRDINGRTLTRQRRIKYFKYIF